MEAYENTHFTEDGNCVYGSSCCHCANETIQPFQIPPNTKVILWDHQHCGLSQIVHLSQYRKPLVRIKNKIIGSGSGMVTKMKQGIARLMAVGTLSYNTDSIDGGLCILLNQLQENCAEDQLATPIIFAKNASIPSTKEEEYLSDLKFISEQYHCHVPIDSNKFIKMRVKCLTKGLSCQIMVEMISVATKFIATPIPPIPTVMTALSNRLIALSSRKEMQTGFIIIDKFRKLVLLLENDPKVFEFPIVGVWVSGVPSVIHPFVWISFLRYISCPQYPNRLCMPPQPFLLALYSSNCELPEYYDCITSDGSQNLSYDLYNGCAVASVSRFPTLDVTVTDIELSRVADKMKWKYFVNAENQLLNKKRQVQNMAQNRIVSNIDDMPQISPVPQPIKIIEAQPLVPDLSLVASRNDISIDPYTIEGRSKSAHCTNCENNSSSELIREAMCPVACVHCESVYPNNDLPFISKCIHNADCFEEKVNAVIPNMNNVRITDDTGFHDSPESNYRSNSCAEHFNTDACTDVRLSEGKQISHKENGTSLANHITSKPTMKEKAPTRNKHPTKIPKPKCKQTARHNMPTSSKPTPAAYSDPIASDVQKAVLLASASTMTSIVWPPTSLETQGTRENMKKMYVDQVLQTDELEFDRNHHCHTDDRKLLKPVVECAATQTSICERKLVDVKEFHCMGCCQCKVRKNCLRTSPICTGSHYDDNDELQCKTSSIDSSVMEVPFSDIFNSDFNSSEDDNLFLGESASTITRDEKRNLHETVINMRPKNKKNECKVDHMPSDYCEEEDFKLYNIIQGYSAHVPNKRTANTARTKLKSPSTVFHSTSENTKKLNSYALKYVEPEILSEFAKSYHLDSVNDNTASDVKYCNQNVYKQNTTVPEEQDFKPSPRNILSSHFSVATNRHLEKYVFS